MMRRPQWLLDAIPRLQAAFQKTAKPLQHLQTTATSASPIESTNLVFPLFTPKIEQSVWKTVPINTERQAAVLVTLVSYHNKPSLIFTTRSSHLPTHQGEVSFPGGHYDSKLDTSLEDTAVREAQEELLLLQAPLSSSTTPTSFPNNNDDDDNNNMWDDICILGRATPLPSIVGTPVTPIIAVLSYEVGVEVDVESSSDDDVGHQATIFPGSPDEVDDVFCVSIEELLEVETVEPSDRFRSEIPVFHTHNNKRIWGLTAVITRPLLHKLFKRVLL
jgi:8-oxo-dGTP pyrophosphatase MutT (NUDIX family)